jgi:hypothetical protein
VRIALLGVAISVLVLMLALSLPVGSDDGVHGGALLHTSLPHTHAGAAVAPTTARRSAAFSPDPSFTAGSAPTTQLPSAGLTPPLPHVVLTLGSGDPGWRRLLSELAPGSWREPPPDPPPSGMLHDQISFSSVLSVHMWRPVSNGIRPPDF